jgi:NAD(P)H-hydrate epimerase
MNVVTGAQMREIDRRTTAEFGIPSLLLMENAALRVVAAAEEMLRAGQGRRVVVVAGKGNNGGDGFAAARHLHTRGWDVVLWLVGDPDAVQGDARVNLEIARRVGVPLWVEDGMNTAPSPASESPAMGGPAMGGPALGGPATEVAAGTAGSPPARTPGSAGRPGLFDGAADLIIDALLGTGVRGAPTGEVATAIEAINQSGAPVLAVDLPSGLDADTGAVAGACIQATRTVTFALPKRGLLVYPGRARVGEIEVAEIGIPRPLLDDPALKAHWITAAQAAVRLPERPADGHKGTFGRVFVLAGSSGLTGAAILASEAALRVGAGLVTLGIPRSLNPILEVKLTEVMTLPLAETGTGALSGEAWETIAERVATCDALAIGPGLGRHPETVSLVRRVLKERQGPLVVDADALNQVAPAGLGVFPSNAVITPHPAELARLVGTSTAEIQSNRLAAAENAARELGCVVVLKGAGTIAAAPDGHLWIGPAGTAALATGGTGDVLTGVIAGLMAQGLPPLDAAIAGVYVHGRAGEMLADEVGLAGALAGELLPILPRVLQKMRSEWLRDPGRECP